MRVALIFALGSAVAGCTFETAGLERSRFDAGAVRMDAGAVRMDAGDVRMDAGDVPVDTGVDLPDRVVGVDVPAGCVPAVEICNGLDDNCDGFPDDGFRCVQSSTTACVTACGTPGAAMCNAMCSDLVAPCHAAAEVCGNGCDDDGNGVPDDGCPPVGPPNDHCDGATLLARAGVLGGVSLVGAVNDMPSCGGVDVFFAVDLTQESFVYLDTFGSGFDTIIKDAGSGCPALPPTPTCADDSCGTVESQLAALVGPGRHYFAVGAATASLRPITLTYRVSAAAGGEDVSIPVSGHVDGSTSGGVDAVTHSCLGAGGVAPRGAPEDGFWWMQCPGDSRRVVVNTCASQTNYDTVLYVAGPGLDACNDDLSSCGQKSELDFMATGAGLFEVFVDGWDGLAGNYRLNVPMF